MYVSEILRLLDVLEKLRILPILVYYFRQNCGLYHWIRLTEWLSYKLNEYKNNMADLNTIIKIWHFFKEFNVINMFIVIKNLMTNFGIPSQVQNNQ